MTCHVDEIYRCMRCGRTRDPTPARLQSFAVPIEISGPDQPEPILFHGVQSAFDHFLENDYNDVHFEIPCIHCQHNQWSKKLRAARFPQVMLISLNRFKVVQVAPGQYESRCVTHQVTPTPTLNFQGQL